jgi:cytochrome c oxidase assembly protein subunit 15
MSRTAHNSALHRFAILTAVATLLLVGMGGLVTSHRAGLAVPDWPTSYGYNMFALPFQFWSGGALYEHTHRLWASAVGFMTAALAVWFYGRGARPLVRWTGLVMLLAGLLILLLTPQRRDDALMCGVVGLVALGAAALGWPGCDKYPAWLRRLGVIAFVAVVVQGVLGGLRVTELMDELGVFHATLAQLFFVLICALVLFTSRWWHEPSVDESHATVPRGLRWSVVAVTLVILLQLILGAAMRHQHAGLAIPDFPLAYGKLWPATDPESVLLYNQRRMEVTEANPITAVQIHLQMIHRIVAVIILLAVTLYVWRVTRQSRLWSGVSKLALAWLGLILVQVALGAATIWTNKAADIATAHVFVGALSLATGGLLCIVSLRNPNRAPGAVPIEISAANLSDGLHHAAGAPSPGGAPPAR